MKEYRELEITRCDYCKVEMGRRDWPEMKRWDYVKNELFWGRAICSKCELQRDQIDKELRGGVR